MALFKTIDDIVAFAPVMHSLNFADLLPDIERAERKYLIPEVGKEIYNELHTAYTNAVSESSLTTAQKNLLKKMRVPVAQFSFFLYAPKGNVNVGSSGITQDFSNDRKPAFPKDVEKMEYSYLDGGYEGLDDLVEFLTENAATYTTWTNSSAHAKSKELFVNTAKEFQEHFNINSNPRTYRALRAVLKDYDFKLIQNVTGEALYDELKQQIYDDAVTSDNDKLLVFIRAAIVHNTVAAAVNKLSIEIHPDFGLTVIAASSTSTGNSRDNRTPAADNKLTNLQQDELVLAQQALDNLKAHLQENAEDYPLYQADAEASTENLEEEKFTNDPDSGIFML